MTTLQVSHYMPEDHGTHADFIAPWVQAVEEASGGTLSLVVHPGNTPLGRLENQYVQVAAGTVDVAHSPAHLPPGRFPRTGIVGLPFMVDSTAQATRLLWRLYQDGDLAGEFDAFHVLALHADSGALLHTRDGPITGRADLAGLSIRSPNPAVSAALECLGAEPVQVPPPRIRAAVDAGELDGAVMAWDVLAYSNTADAFRHHLDTRLFFAPLYFVMNRASYAALPQAGRDAIDRVSGNALVERFPAWWAEWEAPGAALGRAQGHDVATLDAAELRRWRDAVTPAIDAWLDLIAASAPDARAIHAKARRLLDQ
jgi:TRAP-type C4-dicarboxylate transport system substrate-binding protein